MQKEDGRLWISFKWEIWNCAGPRKDLQ